MSNFANDIDSAMDLLKGEEPEEEVVETEEEDVQKSDVEIDMIKAEDDVAELIQADDFMLSLARNQDANVELLAQAVGNNMAATAALGDVLKGFNEKLENLSEAIVSLGAVPRPRKAALSKGEAQEVLDAQTDNPVDAPQVNPLEGATLSKADVVRVLVEGSKDEACTPDDVMKAESSLGGGSSMRVVEVEDFIPSLSPGGQRIVKGLIESQKL